MTVRPSTPEQVEEAQRQLRELLKSSTPEAKNVNLAIHISGDTFFAFRGRRKFRVPPVPYPEGAKLQALYLLFHKLGELPEEEQLGEQANENFVRLASESSQLFWRLVQPCGLLDRIFWRWLSNPFQNISERELVELFNFFFSCRMKSGVRMLESSVLMPSPSLLTSPTSSSSTSSDSDTLPGLQQMVSRSAGGATP